MKFLNPWDILFILAVTVAVHIALKPLYDTIDNAAGG